MRNAIPVPPQIMQRIAMELSGKHNRWFWAMTAYTWLNGEKGYRIKDTIQSLRIACQAGTDEGLAEFRQVLMDCNLVAAHRRWLINKVCQQAAAGARKRSAKAEHAATVRWAQELGRCSEHHKESKPQPVTWVHKAANIWFEASQGYISHAVLGKMLKPLVIFHGEDNMLDGLKRYLRETPPKFYSLKHFTSNFGRWAQPKPPMNTI